ncbi:MAG: T9SS type A sorting domain-containing protein [Flavobacteriales bacterium]|nr:T9SS type A sorting domain-containing protein [Flavobacteriales bacterium]
MKFIATLCICITSWVTHAQWYPIYGPIDSLSTINDIHFLNDSIGFAAVTNFNISVNPNLILNMIWKTVDFGISWEVLFSDTIVLPSNDTFRFSGVFFLNEETGWVCAENSDNIWMTNNSGVTWQQMDTGLVELTQTWPGISDFKDIQFSSLTHGIASSSGTGAHSMKTIDGGYTWSIYDEALGTDLHLLDSCTVYVAASGLIRMSYDCIPYEQVFSPTNEPFNRNAYHIYGFSLDTFIVTTTGISGFNNFGSIAKTVDGGLSYQIIDLLYTFVDADIEFLNDTFGYCSFDSYNSEPALLATFDGGTTWYELYVQINEGESNITLRHLNLTSQEFAYACTENYIYRTVNSGGELGEMHTSIREAPSTFNIQLFPNPADENIILETQNSLDKCAYEIFNLLGQLLESGNFYRITTIPLEGYPSGQYVVRINSGGHNFVACFIKE